LGGEAVVDGCFEGDGVVGEDEGVDVEPGRHGRVAEFTDAVHGIEAAGHADLDDAGAHRAGVRDDVHVAGSRVCCPVGDLVWDGPISIEGHRMLAAIRVGRW
jgi:hypothetical protein